MCFDYSFQTVYRIYANDIPLESLSNFETFLFRKFFEILHIFKVISKTNNQIFASICIFGEYFYHGFHTIHRNDAYNIPLDSQGNCETYSF
jgi:hypothetical protein